MEQALADIKAHLPDFAGYGDEITRRIADEQVRAVVGEALASLHFNHPEYFESGDLAVTYDRLILRCEFTNQSVFKDFEYKTLSVDRRAAIARADQVLIETAVRAESVSADGLAAYLKDLGAALDARDGTLTST